MEPRHFIQTRAALLACRRPAALRQFTVALNGCSRIGSEDSRLNRLAGAPLHGRGRFVAKDASGKARHRMLVGADDERIVLHKFLKERDDYLRLVLGLARERLGAIVWTGTNVSFPANAGRPEHQCVRAAEDRKPRHTLSL